MRVVQPVLRFKDLLGLKSIGIEYGTGSYDSIDGEANVIYLLKRKPSASTKFRYLVISENYHDLVTKDVDLVEITAIDQQFFEMLKRSSSKKLGIEIAVSWLRKTNGQKLAKNIALIKSIHNFTEKYGNQLVLTSGASSIFEMVSGRCFDALLELCDIKPETYWNSLNNWLEHKIDMRCYICDT
jgi:RNase P/RNase MRP subunit p30